MFLLAVVNFSGMGNALSICVGLASAVIAYSAFRISRRHAELASRQHETQVYLFVSNLLGKDELRDCRRIVYAKRRDALRDWGPDEEKKARKVVSSFESAFIATEHANWARKQLITAWGQQIVKAWEAAQLLISKWREEEQASRLFVGFEELARLARESEARPTTST